MMSKNPYVKVTFTSYDLAIDEFRFDVQTIDDHSQDRYTMVMSGEAVARLKQEYDATSDGMGEGMNLRDVAVMCILHDQDEIDSDDPAEFVGRTFEIDN